MAFSLEASALRKVFDGVVAVDSIDLAVPAGSITALLGGNGAGKTTTLGMLLGLIEPSAGQMKLLGFAMPTARMKAAAAMNFSSPYVDLPNRLTVRQNLTVYGHLYGVDDLKERIHELTDLLQLSDFLDRLHGSLSAGQRTRASLAKSLLNRPQLLLLDEPTASLDPDVADWARHQLVGYRDKTGATIFMTSHNMLEVERMCEDVIVMKQGRIVDHGSPQQLLTTHSRNTLEEVFLDIVRRPSAV